MSKKEKNLAARVQKIILNQGLNFLPDAMKTLGKIVADDSAAKPAAKISAARAIIGAMTTASGEMTENEAGQELLRRIRDAEHESSIETAVPQGIKESFDE